MDKNLFELTADALKLKEEAEQIAERLFSDDPEVVASATAQLEQTLAAEEQNLEQLKKKGEAIYYACKSLDGEAALLAEQAKRFEVKARRKKKASEELLDRLLRNLLKISPNETRFPFVNNALTSRPSVSVKVEEGLDLLSLPKEYVKTECSLKKVEAKAAIKAGKEIKGVSLVEKRSWYFA